MCETVMDLDSPVIRGGIATLPGHICCGTRAYGTLGKAGVEYWIRGPMNLRLGEKRP